MMDQLKGDGAVAELHVAHQDAWLSYTLPTETLWLNYTLPTETRG